MKKITVLIFLLLFINNCQNSTSPDSSDTLKLILSANKTSGTAPLTVNYIAKIEGNTYGIIGSVPDYIFFSGTGKTIIKYIIPDTTQVFKNNWADEIIYNTAGEYKVVLLYQGEVNGNKLELYSDTLTVKVY